MGVDPSQTPEEGRNPLPSPSLPPHLKGFRGDLYGEGWSPQAVRVGYRAIGRTRTQTRGGSRGMAQGPFARIHSLLDSRLNLHKTPDHKQHPLPLPTRAVV